MDCIAKLASAINTRTKGYVAQSYFHLELGKCLTNSMQMAQVILSTMKYPNYGSR